MDKSILSKLIILLIAMTVLSSLLNSCNSKDKNLTGKLFSENAYVGDVTVRFCVSRDGDIETFHINASEEEPKRIHTLNVQSLTVDAITGSSISYGLL